MGCHLMCNTPIITIRNVRSEHFDIVIVAEWVAYFSTGGYKQF